MLGRRTLILICSVVLAVKSVVVTQNEDYSPYSAAIIDFLNGNPDQIYNYKNAVLVSTQDKDNTVDVTIDVVASCVSVKPEERCDDKLLTCYGTVRHNQEEDKYTVLSEVRCKRKDVSAVDFRPLDESARKSTVTPQESKAEPKQDVEIVEKKILRINRPCLGCPFDLNVDAEGAPELVNAALRHVESERTNRHAAVKIIKLQSQVVAGIKYILVLEVVPTICQKDADVSAPCPIDNNAETLTCRVVLWEKPWISSLKTIIKNNCTISQEFVDYSFQNNKDNMGNDINANLNSNNQKKNAELDSQRLTDLESQILQLEVTSKPVANVIPSSDLESQIVQRKITAKPIANPSSDLDAQIQEVVTKSTSNVNSASENQQVVEDGSSVLRNIQEPAFFAPCRSVVNQRLENHKTNENDDVSNEETKDGSEQKLNSADENGAKITKRSVKDDDDSSDSSSSSSEENTTNNIKSYKYKENTENKDHSSKSSSSSSSSSSEESKQDNRIERSIRQLEKITPDEKSIVRDLAEFAAASLDKVDDDNHKRIILQILGAKKLRLDGVYYQIILRLGISHCFEEDEDESCRDKLLKNLTKICKVQVYVDDNLSNPKLVKSQCQNIKKDEHDRNRTNYSRYRRATSATNYEGNQIADEMSGVDLSEVGSDQIKILQYIKTGLHVINSKSVQETKYIVRKIKDLSKQLVSGRLWKVTAELALSDCPRDSDTEHCEELEDGEAKICHFSIWEKPWISNGVRIDITCENDENLYTFPSSVDIDVNAEVLGRFKYFMTKHNKTYSSRVEYNHRLKVFRSNLVKIGLLNKYEMGTGKYDITQFADLTSDEFSRSHGLRLDLHSENNVPFMEDAIPDIELPTEFDWRQKKAVTEVKNQGSCGSCWAFSTTGNVEGQYAIKYGALLEFSEQELVDCDKLDSGCNGGLMDNAYRTIEKIGGLETEGDYPYDARDEKCNFNSTKARVKLSGALNISHDETDMAKWLVQNGPISIAINANAMQFYVGGVSHPWKILCNPKSLDHGVLIVGYGIHNYPLFNKSLPYWTIKNSWGPSWGEQGYYRVYRGDGTCGLNQTPSSAIVA